MWGDGQVRATASRTRPSNTYLATDLRPTPDQGLHPTAIALRLVRFASWKTASGESEDGVEAVDFADRRSR
ncbi:hypothetical protein GCM10009765_49890 [Fodinicola feengrottensis]|uniref:Uncharacterized protein n=1 Tax=Fodinicola feengrottensis TaxID=435914 RepID=A0ABN2HX44_9ACTN